MSQSLLTLLPLEDRATPALMNFLITTATSSLALSGSLGGSPITAQYTTPAPGSLSTTYAGNLAVNVEFSGNTIEFLDSAAGSSMKANISANNGGNMAPAVGGGVAFNPGSAPANYGANVTVSGLATKVATRNMIAAFSAPPQPMSSGSFPSTQTVTLANGTVDYNNILLQGADTLAGSTGANAGSNGSFVDNGNGNYTLVAPCNGTINDTVNGLPLILNIIGMINATAVLPVVDLNGAAAGTDVSFSATAGGSATKFAPTATITRNPVANLMGMTLTLESPPDGLAESLNVSITGTGLTTTGYDPGTGQITIQGSAALSTYQSILRNATYANTNAAGTPGARSILVSVNDGNNTSLFRTATGNISTVPVAKVTSVQENDGSAQRSNVTSLRVSFGSTINFTGAPAAAFQLIRQNDSASVLLSSNVDNSGPGTIVTLSFTGGAVNGTSLADGRYTLTVLASQVAGLDGNGDGTPGDNFTLIGTPANGLFRLFGDSNGDGAINAGDFAQFGNAFNTANPAFDFDGNSTVDAGDFAQFGNRWGVTI